MPQHTFLDYSITNYILAIIFAFAFGEAGNLRPNFIEQVTARCSSQKHSYVHFGTSVVYRDITEFLIDFLVTADPPGEYDDF